MSTDIEITSPSHVAERVRGISKASVVQATLGRFLPAGLVTMGGIGAFVSLQDPSRTLLVAGVLGFQTVMFSVGYGLGLSGMRRWLYPDAKVTGRRSVVAGLFTPLYAGAVSLFTQGLGLMEIGLLATVIGLVMALVLFFAWLTPTPSVDYEAYVENERRLPVSES